MSFSSTILVGILYTALTVTAHAADAQVSPGFHNQSEAGIAITSGNTQTQSFHFDQLNTNAWGRNLLRFKGSFLKSSTKGTETARYWTLGLRYEREFIERLSGFLGQTIESDLYSGYMQRYATDIGAKYFIFKEDTFLWSAEAGYRYTIENRLTGGQFKQHYLRAYTEASRDWTKTFSTKLWIEYLPNLSAFPDYQLNTEFSISATLTEILALKTGYLLRYRNVLLPPATKNADSQFITALVAKF